MGPLTNRSNPVQLYAVIVLTVLAPALGGTNQLWAKAIICAGTGILFLLVPPRRSLGVLANLLFGGLLLLALIGFLPVSWFGIPVWRSELVRLGAAVPPLVSAQPWLTLQWALEFAVGLVWAYYLLTTQWSLEDRRKIWVSVSAATMALAAALVVSFLLKKRIPFWPTVAEYGFFPNRNHTANVLALGGIVTYATCFQSLQEQTRTWWVWFAGLCVICSALILNYSRGGIVLFFGGAFVWTCYSLVKRNDKRLAYVAFAGLIFLAGIFLWNGVAILARFRTETGDFLSLSRNGRFGIYRDAIALAWQTPLAGLGLSNFSPAFTITQRYSVAENIAAHPESDWLWTAVDMGWFAPLLILLLFCWWAGRCFPFEPGTRRFMRMGSFICGCGFALHALVDVPGHHIGAIWPALLLAGTAVHPDRIGRLSGSVTVFFRIAGASLLGIAGWWLASATGANTFPTTAILDRDRREIEIARDTEDYPRLIELTSRALTIAPLDWDLYFTRGVAELEQPSPARSQAAREFAIARYLLPNWPDLYLKEGIVWLGAGEPDLAFDVWGQGMNRLPNDLIRPYYADMYGTAKSDADWRDRWRKLGRGRSDCVLIFLQNATPAEFQIELIQILEEDPELRMFSPAELARLFELWYQRGEKLLLAETLQGHPEWQEIGWRELARVYGDYQDYRQAYETVKRFVPSANVGPAPNESLPSLALRFQATNNVQDGLSLALAEAAHGQIDDALAIIAVLKSRPQPGALVYYVEAELLASKEDWPRASEAIWNYAGALKAE